MYNVCIYMYAIIAIHDALLLKNISTEILQFQERKLV